MSEIIIDASLALAVVSTGRGKRGYSLAVLQQLSSASAVVPILWFYEVGNGLTMAVRRKRITVEQRAEYLARIPRLPISNDHPDPAAILRLPDLAHSYELTNYDAAYLDLAMRRRLAPATTDEALRRAAGKAGVALARRPKRGRGQITVRFRTRVNQ